MDNESKKEQELPINDAEKKVVAARQTVQFSGPLPHPLILEHYNKIVPGAAERILVMAEKQSKHRRELEAKVISSEIKDAKLGLWFGFLIGMSTIMGGVIVMVSGAEIAGGFVSTAGIASLVGVFVYGSRQRRFERKERREEQQDKQ